MAVRLLECHRILKETGSLYLHCDPTMSHYLKLLMDCIFGEINFRNEIIWCYHGPGSPKMRQSNRKSDSIFWYSKSKVWTFNGDDVRVPFKDPNQSLRTSYGDRWHVILMKRSRNTVKRAKSPKTGGKSASRRGAKPNIRAIPRRSHVLK